MDTSTEKREWDISKFLKVAQYLNKKDFLLVLLGTKKSKSDYFNKYGKNIRYIDLIGKTTVSEAIDIIANSRFYIGLDTGLSHIAAGVDIPGIVIFSNSKFEEPWNASSVKRMRPRNKKIKIIQPEEALAPCKTICLSKIAHCINLVKSEDVIIEIEKMLKEDIN